MPQRNPVILLVDDDANDRFLIQRSLQKMGIENPVFEAKDGAQAIAYLAGEREFADRKKYPYPGILFLDLKMPETDGFEVLEWIRAQGSGSDFLLIVLSRNDELRQVNRAYALGANSFLAKPGTEDDLQELITAFRDYWLVRGRPVTSLMGARPNEESV
jgi:CheY-like chemotaxis protein